MASQADDGLHHLENELPTHKNERRPGGRAAPVPVYSGWAPLPCAVWMEVAETFAKPWSRPVACADLTTHQSVAIQPVDPVRFPSIGDLTERWGWSAHEVRRLLTDEAAWSDPTLTGNGDRAARWAAIKDARTSRSGSHGSRTDRARIAHGSRKDATVEPAESTTKAHGFNEDRARIELTSLNTRVGSQSTEHRAQTQEKPAPAPAPAPAVADLFASLDSQTSADTGKAAGEDERASGVAEPAKPKRSRKAKVDDADPADVDAVIGLWAKVCPRTEKQAARMLASQPVRRQIAAAIDRDGADVVKARFAYIAGGSGGQAEWARKCIADESRPMQIDALLRDPSRQDRNKGGPPWVATVDGEAADWTEQTASGTTMTPRALAVEAWANMMLDPRWKRITIEPPNRPGDFGQPSRWDLAETADEHDRRMTAFLRAGSIPKWRDADAQGRHDFRERWIGFYMDEVTA